jgi:hypoxanthine-DNA glycosylase
MLNGLAPRVTADTRLVVLGSFPGAASLASQQYYGHPQNHFWKILRLLWPADAPPATADYRVRIDWMLSKGVGLWDVYAHCERSGSLDSQIRQPVQNDLAALMQSCPRWVAVAHNGAESARHAALTQGLGLTVHRLPSTSAANATWSLDRKLAAWRKAFEAHGLLAPAA